MINFNGHLTSFVTFPTHFMFLKFHVFRKNNNLFQEIPGEWLQNTQPTKFYAVRDQNLMIIEQGISKVSSIWAACLFHCCLIWSVKRANYENTMTAGTWEQFFQVRYLVNPAFCDLATTGNLVSHESVNDLL